ncbi:tail fiber assembly protein [Xenorhabdus szentirmaii]|nr:tail fiber assembly protein [Xenorhabdus szentirmaii]PHM32020.1 tail fiber assembly protein [Xenorhabdus szentirmaii DSM 16338]
MKHYKSKDNQIHAFESDGSQDAWIEPDFVPITEEEARAILYPPPTPEQWQQQAGYEKQYRMDVAKEHITPLQYATDLNMATTEEQAALTAWKKYCVLLNRVDCSIAPDIAWPKQPK